ncbi:alpha-amylase family glycosyl hydrolase [Paenibacillus sp. JCM 10914]|uniref:alpha-amylase family glycosyl hydrolase n=1 Tax=Paenibacillus sp. JCM 10914 TaxID=1236974 RepID=UPI0003CC70A0|nr:alpha-amylase family glycosyl hydrolase [Paenibacillus sp. JCM 10914]GAE08989.1 trehalose synthase [Paenibacillus sp. JCM 10914]
MVLKKRVKRSSVPVWLAALTVTAGLLLAGCSENTSPPQEEAKPSVTEETLQPEVTTPVVSEKTEVDEQPSDVYYEIFVRSFYDSDGDGIGDLQGVIEKLDYLNDGNSDTTDDLGVTGIWLMPIHPSPSYHGYDVTDYRDIHPDYGTLEDFKLLLAEADKRGIKVIMDLVVNHTSTEHPWFQESAQGADADTRDWYVWAEDQGKEPTGASAAGSGTPWHEKNGAHYMGTFWGGMPDLNFDNPKVREEMKDIGKFWLELGVDGFRIDAAKHIFEDLVTDKGEATTAKNTAWWQEFRASLNEVNPDAYIVGEIWDNSAAVIAPYLDKAFDSGFNFGLGESILGAVKNEKDNNLAFTLERTYGLFSQVSGGAFSDATFLTNHDINRTMSQLQGNEHHARMAAGILLTMPGNPFIYYGEEIGMKGTKPDEQIREPMIWSNTGSDKGQTTWEPLKHNQGDSVQGVEQQLRDADSLLSRYRTLIGWRNDMPAIHSGTIESFASGNAQVMAYVRRTDDNKALVVHNLSGKEQTVELAPKSGDDAFQSLARTTDDSAALNGSSLTLPPYTTVILE